MCCYRPQQQLRKGYVFTGVCHSVHRGEGVCDRHPPEQTLPLAHIPWADTPLTHPPDTHPPPRADNPP